MTAGPGKYDDLCSLVRARVGLGGSASCSGGGVVVIVVGGDKGSGFSCQADLATTLALPEMLEEVARQMRKPVVRS